jgi:hypothetical protein
VVAWERRPDRRAGRRPPAVITLQGRGPEADLIDARVRRRAEDVSLGPRLGTWVQNQLDEQFGVGPFPLTVAGSAPAFFVNDRDLGPADDMGFMDLVGETAGLPGACSATSTTARMC